MIGEGGTVKRTMAKASSESPLLLSFFPFLKWICRLIVLILVTSPQICNSDFNVILPEICNHPGLVNLTWIQSMVLLGTRDEQTPPALNILSPEEVCDGSNGLLKFISLAHSDPNLRMIASLQQPLCPSAATFSHVSKRQFISWTCSQMPGVHSLKPDVHDVILAIQRMLNFSQWNNIALTKSRFDRSPFCDEVGAYLQNDMRNDANISVMILGNYEDLESTSTSFTSNLDGLFLCISYDYGFTHNLSLKTEFKTRGFNDRGIPTVLLLQWPLPVEVFSPAHPTLAVVADTHPRIPTTSSFDFQQKSWDPLETPGENILPHKLLETLLAQMILKSVKMSLEMDRKEIEEELTTSLSSSSSSSSSGHSGSGGDMPIPSKNSNHNFHHFPRHYNGKSGYQQPEHQFLFSVLQYEKSRWHPLINLVNGPPMVNSQRNLVGNHEAEIDNDYLMTWIQVALGLIFLGVASIGLVIAAIYTRRRARKRDFSSTKHCRKLSRRHRGPGSCKLILTESDLTFGPFVSDNPKKSSKSPFIGGLSSFQRSSQDKPDLLKGSFSTGLRKQSSVTNMKNETGILTGTGEHTARYKGDLVYLKRLPCNGVSSDSFEVKMKSMLVLETLHGLRHENLSTMIGCFAGGVPSVPALVWELCSRGSLHDIIKQSDIKLDWAFKLSLLTDLVRGMKYLSSSLVRVHGFLTSHNCCVDARWVLKITDYGLPAFYYTQGLALPARSAKELLWTAPELLRNENLMHQGTQAGDVYSFAIIMQEILTRGEPYCMLTLTAEEILEKVKRPPPLIRPSVSKGAAPPEAINIMRQCWAELPDMRPDFMVIHDLFKTLNHGRKANIVDTMFQMLEKYSNNLEELIRERTEQLDLEKKKTEQLLNRMLPNTVAEKLKLGLPFDPEEFSQVTIYFSDIVGFTTISAFSTPFEVVDLLNDLYTCFDATINDYNVYKVETIGDAYMVVGGAPLWSHDHASQIATMALDLLHESGKFRIRHLPYTPLRLRIGLHTGPCCAGVVGLTMPRYCLFGDTVNTASRMESTGAPWRIHVSAETKAKLDEAGGYIIEHRGMTAIKGKGPMPTYWLLGKEGFDKELPKPPGLEECHRLDENAIKYGRTGVWPGSVPSPTPSSVSSIEELSSSPIPNVNTKGNSNSTVVPPPPTIVTGILTTSVKTGNLTGEISTVSMSPTTSPNHLAPPKSTSSFAVISGGGGETMRSLSPAEQIAHQLLNGRPTTKGLRRQLSLDHRAMPVLLKQAASIRRAPSLEENLEITSSGCGSGSSLVMKDDNTTTTPSKFAGDISSGGGKITSSIKIFNETDQDKKPSRRIGVEVKDKSSSSTIITSPAYIPSIVQTNSVIRVNPPKSNPATRDSSSSATTELTNANITTSTKDSKETSHNQHNHYNKHAGSQNAKQQQCDNDLHSSSSPRINGIELEARGGCHNNPQKHSEKGDCDCNNIFLGDATITNPTTLSTAPVHAGSKINNSNYVVVDANSIASVNNVFTGLTVSSSPVVMSNPTKVTTNTTTTNSNTNLNSVGLSANVSFITESSSTSGSVTSSPVTSKLKLNSRAAKLAKILSVVEENESPGMDRKYEIVTNQV